MVGRMQNRPFPQACQTRSTHNRLARPRHCRASGKALHRKGWHMKASRSIVHHALVPQRRYFQHNDLASCLIAFRHEPYVNSQRSKYKPEPLPIPLRHRHHANLAKRRSRLTNYRMRSRHMPHVDTMSIHFFPDAIPFVRRCLRGPAYVSYRRFASYSTAGEWLRPFEPRKGQRHIS